MPDNPAKEFFTAAEVAKTISLSPASIRRWASGASPGSLYDQCVRGRWHREQIRIIVAIRAGAISRDSGEARWQLFKHELARSLPADKVADKPVDKPETRSSAVSPRFAKDDGRRRHSAGAHARPRAAAGVRPVQLPAGA